MTYLLLFILYILSCILKKDGEHLLFKIIISKVCENTGSASDHMKIWRFTEIWILNYKYKNNPWNIKFTFCNMKKYNSHGEEVI